MSIVRKMSFTLSVAVLLGTVDPELMPAGQENSSAKVAPVQQSIQEICDLEIPFSGMARVRGAGRLTDDGFILADTTCPVTVGDDSIPRSVVVIVSRFRESADGEAFSQSLDSAERPVVQVVVGGVLDCKRVESAHSGKGRWTGFGRTGAISCRMNDATVDTIVQFF